MAESAGLEQRRRHDVAERGECHGRRHHEERNLAESEVEASPDGFRARRIDARGARHGRQLRRGDRHAEQADRQGVEQLSVRQAGDGAGRQQARQKSVDVRAHLHDAAADENGKKVASDDAYVLGRHPGRQAQIGGDRQNYRHLHEELQRAADDRSPGKRHGKARQRRARAEHDERRDHRGVPHHAAGVREQEPSVAVQHTQAPRGQREQSGARKQDADDVDRQLALLAPETRRDDRDEKRRGDDADEHEHGDDEREQRGHRAGDAIGLAPIAAREQRGVHRNERSGERAFAKQILQNVRNAERRGECVGGVVAEAEVV